MAEAPTGRWLRLPPDLPLPRLLREAGWTVEVAAVRRRKAQLWDTADRRLAAAGAELTLEARDGWRWRREARGHPKVVAQEWVAPAHVGDELVARWTRAYRRGRPLTARAQADIRRREVRTTGEQPVAFVEEWLTVRPAAPGGSTLRRVLASTPSRAPEDAGAVEAVRRRALPAEPPLAVLPPSPPRARRLAVPATVDDPRSLFTRSAVLSVMQWQHYDCELSAAPAGDNVRKLRVAVRRLRSDLQTFLPLLDPAWARAQRETLAGLGTRIGEVRDAEVLRDRLAGLVDALAEPERADAVPLLDLAASQLDARREALLAFLGTDEYLDLLDAAVGIATSPRWSDDQTASPRRMARKRLRRLQRHVDGLSEPAAPADLHRTRILAKRARYAAEACVPVAGAAAERAAARLADLQTVLGEHHDAIVTRDWLAQRRLEPAGAAFAAGQLVVAETRRVERAEASWRRAWEAAAAKEVWRWLRR